MKVYDGIEHLNKKYKKPVVAIGVFDGIHKGHKQLIERTVAKAKAIHGTSMVMTFHPHPVQVLRPELQLPTLISLSYRMKLIEKLGVDVCVVIHFTKSFSQLSPGQFTSRYLVKKIKPQEIYVGYDFRFGRNRSGDLKLFEDIGEKSGFKVNIVRAIKGNNKAISSTLIRNLIAEGALQKSSRLLGRPVSILGVVTRGDSRGKRLGFPTANINPNCEVIPPNGVYAVRIRIQNSVYNGMANIGRRPSFKKTNSRVNMEVHIFDFNRNIYGKEIIIDFLKKIREEKAFISKELFVKQLTKDEQKIRAYLRHIKVASAAIHY